MNSLEAFERAGAASAIDAAKRSARADGKRRVRNEANKSIRERRGFAGSEISAVCFFEKLGGREEIILPEKFFQNLSFIFIRDLP